MTILVTVILYLCLQWVRSRRLTVRLVVASALLAVIVVFVASSTLKVVTGGWLPLGIGAVVFVIMTAWRNGRERLRVAARQDEEGDAADVLNELSSPAGDQDQHSVRRVPGCGVFLTEDTDVAPAALRTLAERMHTLPEQIVLLSWRVEDNPSSMAREASVSVTRFGPQESDQHDFGLVGVDVVLGYRERLDVNHVLQRAIEKEPEILGGIDPDEATYCVSEAIPRLSRHGAMPRWQQRLFLTLSRLTTDRIEQLQLPRARSIIIGRQVDL